MKFVLVSIIFFGICACGEIASKNGSGSQDKRSRPALGEEASEKDADAKAAPIVSGSKSNSTQSSGTATGPATNQDGTAGGGAVVPLYSCGQAFSQDLTNTFSLVYDEKKPDRESIVRVNGHGALGIQGDARSATINLTMTIDKAERTVNGTDVYDVNDPLSVDLARLTDSNGERSYAFATGGDRAALSAADTKWKQIGCAAMATTRATYHVAGKSFEATYEPALPFVINPTASSSVYLDFIGQGLVFDNIKVKILTYDGKPYTTVLKDAVTVVRGNGIPYTYPAVIGSPIETTISLKLSKVEQTGDVIKFTTEVISTQSDLARYGLFKKVQYEIDTKTHKIKSVMYVDLFSKIEDKSDQIPVGLKFE